MRALPTFAASAAVLLLATGVLAADLRHFEDAALYAVQFADAEGRKLMLNDWVVVASRAPGRGVGPVSFTA